MSVPTNAESVAASLQPAAEACIKMLMHGNTEAETLAHIIQHYDLPVPMAKIVLRNTCDLLQGNSQPSFTSPGSPTVVVCQPRKSGNRLALRIPSLLLGLILAFVSVGGFLSGSTGPAAIVLFIAATLIAVFFVFRPSPRH